MEIKKFTGIRERVVYIDGVCMNSPKYIELIRLKHGGGSMLEYTHQVNKALAEDKYLTHDEIIILYQVNQNTENQLIHEMLNKFYTDQNKQKITTEDWLEKIGRPGTRVDGLSKESPILTRQDNKDITDLKTQEALFIDFTEKMRLIIFKKGNDYSEGGIDANADRLSNFKLAGSICGLSAEQNCLSLIATKCARLGVLLKKSTAENESVDDSLLDMANYCFLLYCLRMEKIK